MSDTLPIHQWPADLRPRERLLELGAEKLADAELLALLLRTGVRGRSALDLARELIIGAGDLRALLRLPWQQLAQRGGIGPAKWASLQAAAEIGRRVQGQSLRRGQAIAAPADVQAALRAHLRDRDHEVFAALFLDARHQVLAFEELFRGNLTGAAVYVGEVAKRALQHGAAAMVVAHNHPSGVAEPSSADREITERLRQALALLDVRLLDHIVVGEGECCSFAERGWM